jgi:hypothetical protein
MHSPQQDAMLPYERFTWREASPGTWQRDSDELEQFYTAIAKLYEGTGRMFFAMTGHVSLIVVVGEKQSRIDAEKRLEYSLQQAWLRLRYEQPTIASWVEYDAAASSFTKTYQSCRDSVEQAAWINTTIKTISTGQTGKEWCNSDPPAPKIPTLFIITPPSSSTNNSDASLRRDLVLRSPHQTIDGIGTLHLLNRLIFHASAAYTSVVESESLAPTAILCDGSESVNLSPSFRVAAAIPPTPTPIQEKLLQELATRKAASIGNGIEIEALTIPYKQGVLVPGRHQRVEYVFSQEETRGLLAICKANDVTVTHAFHAGIGITLRDIQERKEVSRSARYSTYLLRSERDKCLPPYNTPLYAAAVYHTAPSNGLDVDLTIPSSKDEGRDGIKSRKEFMRILYIMRDYYHECRSDTGRRELEPFLWAKNIPVLPEEAIRLGQPLPVPPPNLLPSVSLSSLGNIDKIIASSTEVFEISNPWVTGEELRNGLGIFLGTFRNQLCLSAAFNDAWHDDEDALSFLQRCKEVVVQGLGIGSASGLENADI